MAWNRLLEDPEVVARVRADPRAFLDDLRVPAILDEIRRRSIPTFPRPRFARPIENIPERKPGMLLSLPEDLRRWVVETRLPAIPGFSALSAADSSASSARRTRSWPSAGSWWC